MSDESERKPSSGSEIEMNSRPLTVKIGVASLFICTVLFVVYVVLSARWKEPLPFAVAIIIGAGIQCLLYFLIFQGKNWARWFFVVLFTIGLFPSYLYLQKPLSHSTVIYFLTQTVLQAVAVIALILPWSNKWYRKMSAKPQHVVEDDALAVKRKYVSLGLGIGAIILLASVLILPHSPNTGVVLNLFGAGFFTFGCMNYAEVRGWSKWIGLAGMTSFLGPFMGLIGLFFVFCFRDKNLSGK
jgi:hypothetical protein